MADFCPGRSIRDLEVKMYHCPHCQMEVEFFSDEAKRRCPSCKELIFVEREPACFDWCPVAKECRKTFRSGKGGSERVGPTENNQN